MCLKNPACENQFEPLNTQPTAGGPRRTGQAPTETWTKSLLDLPEPSIITTSTFFLLNILHSDKNYKMFNFNLDFLPVLKPNFGLFVKTTLGSNNTSTVVPYLWLPHMGM